MRSKAMQIAVAAAVAAAFLSTPLTAKADEVDRLAVVLFLTIGIEPDAAQKLSADLGTAIATETGLTTFAGADVMKRLVSPDLPDGCHEDPACVRELCSKLLVERTLFLLLSGGKSVVDVEASLNSCTTGETIRHSNWRLPSDAESWGADLTRVARDLFPDIGDGSLNILGEAGTRVSVDGGAETLLPLAGPIRLTAGVHKLSLHRDGYLSRNMEVRVFGGMTSTIKPSLRVGTDPVDPGITTSTDPGVSATDPGTGAPKPARKRMEDRLRKAVKAKGLALEDLAFFPSISAAYRGFKHVKKAGDVERTKDAARLLAEAVEKVSLDRAFFGAKIAAISARLDALATSDAARAAAIRKKLNAAKGRVPAAAGNSRKARALNKELTALARSARGG